MTAVDFVVGCSGEAFEFRIRCPQDAETFLVDVDITTVSNDFVFITEDGSQVFYTEDGQPFRPE